MPLVFGCSRTADADGWRRAVKRLAFDSAAHNKVVATPAVVRAVAVAGQRAAKVRSRKRRDAGVHPQINGGLVESGHGIADAFHVGGVAGDQVVVQIKAAKGHKKDLAFGTQAAARTNQAGDHFQLRSQRVASDVFERCKFSPCVRCGIGANG